jgi:large subunit ribosomal protein L29e
VVNFVDFQVDAKFLRNQRFAKKHNLKPEAQKKRAEQRKADKAGSV